VWVATDKLHWKAWAVADVDRDGLIIVRLVGWLELNGAFNTICAFKVKTIL